VIEAEPDLIDVERLGRVDVTNRDPDDLEPHLHDSPFLERRVAGALKQNGEPGTTRGAQLVVDDIDAVRAALADRGVPISDVMQLGPEGAPGSRFAFFDDPDGNGWSLQEIKRS